MAQYVTLQQAADHLKLPDALGGSPVTALERDLQQKLDAAEDIVLEWLENRDFWPAPDAMPRLQAIILLQLGELWRFRGDDPAGEGPASVDGYLSPDVKRLLTLLRRRVFA